MASRTWVRAVMMELGSSSRSWLAPVTSRKLHSTTRTAFLRLSYTITSCRAFGRFNIIIMPSNDPREDAWRESAMMPDVRKGVFFKAQQERYLMKRAAHQSTRKCDGLKSSLILKLIRDSRLNSVLFIKTCFLSLQKDLPEMILRDSVFQIGNTLIGPRVDYILYSTINLGVEEGSMNLWLLREEAWIFSKRIVALSS